SLTSRSNRSNGASPPIVRSKNASFGISIPASSAIAFFTTLSSHCSEFTGYLPGFGPEFRVVARSVVHVPGADVFAVSLLVEPEVEAAPGDTLGVPALAAMRNDPVEGEPAGIRRALDLGCLREALPPPVNPRFQLDCLHEASTALGRDLPNATIGRLVPERHQPLGRQAIGVQLFGDEFEDWLL